jgi:hypothetical protein
MRSASATELPPNFITSILFNSPEKQDKRVYTLLLGASCRFAAGPGFPLQFLGFAHCKSCGISASIPCAFRTEAFFPAVLTANRR